MKSWVQALHKTECGGPGVYLQHLEVEQECKKFKVVVVWVRNAFHWLRHLDHWSSAVLFGKVLEEWPCCRKDGTGAGFENPALCFKLTVEKWSLYFLLLPPRLVMAATLDPFWNHKPKLSLPSVSCFGHVFCFFFFFHHNRKGIDAEVIRSMRLGWPPRDSVSMQNQTATKQSLKWSA